MCAMCLLKRRIPRIKGTIQRNLVTTSVIWKASSQPGFVQCTLFLSNNYLGKQITAALDFSLSVRFIYFCWHIKKSFNNKSDDKDFCITFIVYIANIKMHVGLTNSVARSRHTSVRETETNFPASKYFVSVFKIQESIILVQGGSVVIYRESLPYLRLQLRCILKLIKLFR